MGEGTLDALGISAWTHGPVRLRVLSWTTTYIHQDLEVVLVDKAVSVPLVALPCERTDTRREDVAVPAERADRRTGAVAQVYSGKESSGLGTEQRQPSI